MVFSALNEVMVTSPTIGSNVEEVHAVDTQAAMRAHRPPDGDLRFRLPVSGMVLPLSPRRGSGACADVVRCPVRQPANCHICRA